MGAIVLTYYSNVKDGHLQKNVRAQIANDVKHFEGKRVEIIIRKLKSTRSSQQNRLYWLYVTIIANEIGYLKEDVHDIIKFKFLRKEKVFQKTGEIIEYLGSSAALSKTEFSELVNNLIQWSAETFDIVLPMPNEQLELI